MFETTMSNDIQKMRNIGISAHIDSGKTTLTERVLFYTDRIHAIHEVRGKDGVGATMDSMELERERGITIASAATNVTWGDHQINIIDTPGHVDFTIEVERALRVLDGAILVLDAVAGVQSQTYTVNRQLNRYSVPFLAFVNKCDRAGADPLRVCKMINKQLGHTTLLMQLPIGLEDKLEGVVDLLAMRAYYFDGEKGETVRVEGIPEDMRAEAEGHHEQLLDALSLHSDELAEKILEGTGTYEDYVAELRRGVIARDFVPVFMGSAYKNRGVQPLLDAVVKFLPNPTEPKYQALDIDAGEQRVDLSAESSKPTVALAFKLEESPYGQLTYLRIYQGSVQKGVELYNTRAQRKVKIGRLIKMHSKEMEDVVDAPAGDIVALFGIECSSGDTFVAPSLNLSMTSMHVPEPVISLAIKPKDKASSSNMAKALGRFTREDPTFRTFVDEESKETIIQGMGELHLDVYMERMRREYKAEIIAGAPQVAYRETIATATPFDYTHKKQTGGSGQFARVAGIMEPLPRDSEEIADDVHYLFVSKVKGGVIPTEYIPSCDKGFKQAIQKGSLIGAPIIDVQMTVNDGSSHSVDSSDVAFQLASIGAFRQAYLKAQPQIMEPIMKLAVEGPSEFQGSISGSVSQRRGVILATRDEAGYCSVEAEVPLSEMFGYSTILRSLTQGKAEFTMEFLKYGQVPKGISDELKEEYAKANSKE